MSTDFQYIRLADEFERKIVSGDYGVGDKLPSIRMLHHKLGLSISTVYQALIELEKRNLVETRPKSGFYVKPKLQNVLKTSDKTDRRIVPQTVNLNELVSRIIEVMADPSVIQFGGAAPSPELLPSKMLTRAMRKVLNLDMYSLLSYDPPQGNPELRKEIAKRMIRIGTEGVAEQIVITNGCMEAVTLCLMAVTAPGDVVMVESPTFHGFLQIIEDLRLKALELPTHPVEGIDLEVLARILEQQKKIAALVTIPNINNPAGYVMSESNKRRLTRMMRERNIPIIEDGIYSDLYFGRESVLPLKAFDKEGMVLYCSSFSKTLAPGLRIGWTIPGRFYTRVKRLKVNTSVISPGFNQAVIARCLKTGFYDRHIARMRNALKVQVARMSAAITEYFPEGTQVTAPRGGMLLWVRLPETVDAFEVYQKAIEMKIAILPGVLCAGANMYKNYVRINCGCPWSSSIENGIKTLGRIVWERM